MEKLIETALFTRVSLLNILESKSYEKLVHIPEKFKNSIFWNIAHLLVTQQLLCYKLSGLEIKIDQDLVSKYGKGATAITEVEPSDIQYVKDNLVAAMTQTKEDFDNGLFVNFTPYMTSTGIELKSVEDAIAFSTFHDGIHLGIVLSLMKIV
ncbi:DinB family protein [Lutimonas halocynthiae]|uniref:DinB family protein n=1 Tax=Lutimonas halocynthiae TaxID=1446477 RepID=UPI0025B5425D|nr:DinB family protein [Lutimonas halocynthiae]MDN3641349.1 DinB family protein [Lutimonas halocynthiae]